MAGLRVEADVLRSAFYLGITPELVDSGVESSVPFLVTRHVAGRIASTSAHQNSLWDALKLSLEGFTELHENRNFPDYGAHPASEFGSQAHPYQCLSRICAEIGIQRDWSLLPPLDLGEPGVVHGSLDLKNVILTGNGAAILLDWEAARRGPQSFDLTSFLPYPGARSLITRAPGGLKAVRAFAVLRQVNRARAKGDSPISIEDFLSRAWPELTG